MAASWRHKCGGLRNFAVSMEFGLVEIETDAELGKNLPLPSQNRNGRLRRTTVRSQGATAAAVWEHGLLVLPPCEAPATSAQTDLTWAFALSFSILPRARPTGGHANVARERRINRIASGRRSGFPSRHCRIFVEPEVCFLPSTNLCKHAPDETWSGNGSILHRGSRHNRWCRMHRHRFGVGLPTAFDED
jgi:hypothetical protein